MQRESVWIKIIRLYVRQLKLLIVVKTKKSHLAMKWR